ncbi:MAG: DUF47 family protein [Thermoguttaceae bacterium]|jgi:uncharacterized protein Yka (UPF0111/DUF47 family)
MFSLQRMFRRGNRFFDLLEASAEEARQSVAAVVELINAPDDGVTLEKLVQRRRQEKRLSEELTALLCSTFVTPLEREDIEALSSALSRIPKVAKKFAERLLLSQPHSGRVLFCEQAKLLEEATEIVAQMVGQLRRGPHLDKVQGQNLRLQKLEGEADKLILQLLREIYGGGYEALEMIVLRDLFELLEKLIDRCRDAGNVIFQTVLKNS